MPLIDRHDLDPYADPNYRRKAMTASEAIRHLRRPGPAFVLTTLNGEISIYVQVVKAPLIKNIRRFYSDGEINAHVQKGRIYFS